MLHLHFVICIFSPRAALGTLHMLTICGARVAATSMEKNSHAMAQRARTVGRKVREGGCEARREGSSGELTLTSTPPGDDHL